MFTANKAVRNITILFAKTVGIIMGLLLLFSCVKMATEYRSKSRLDETITTSARDVEKQLQCMARNIYWEAASEPFEGKVAVAQVTINRVQSGKFADSVCGVVYQKTRFFEKVVCQFSWFCETTHLTRPVYQKLYKESEEVAKMVMLEGFRLPMLKEAIYYHADYVNPRWNKPRITQIGRHIFYKERPNV
jgi:spore germination cell wall hydrolase CwlJ-like protein